MPVTFPKDWLDRGIGEFGAVPKATVDYCDGPETLAVPPQANFRYETRWTAWQASDGIRFAKLEDAEPPDGLKGQLTGLFDGETTTHLSICFDQNARPVVAVQRANNTIEVRRFISGPTFSSWLFDGVDPLMFFNGVLLSDVGETDAICYYMPATRDKILMRRQRDNFGTEYLVGHFQDNVLDAPITKLQKTDWLESYQYIWGYRQGRNRAESKQITIRSGQYPFWPRVAEEEASLQVGFLVGAHTFGVISPDSFSEPKMLNVGFLVGSYDSIIIEGNDSESGFLDVGFLIGNYVSIIVEQSEAEAGSLDIGFLTGDYDLVVVAPDPFTESATLNVGFLSGSYDSA